MEGDPLHINLHMPEGNAKFDNYFWTAKTYEASFAKFGFTNISWVKMGLTDGADRAYWQDWVNHCPLICFEC